MWHTNLSAIFLQPPTLLKKLAGFNTFSRVCFVQKKNKISLLVNAELKTTLIFFFFSKRLDNKQNFKTMPNFLSDKVFLIYASIVENLLKILFGVSSLVFVSSYDIENYSMRSELLCKIVMFFSFHNQFTAIHSIYALVTIGLTGIFISLRYIAKIKDGQDQKNIFWNRFQWLALVYQIFFSYCFFSIHNTGYDRFQMVVFLYSLLDIFGIFSIFAILSTIQSSDDETAADSSDSDLRTIAVKLLNDYPPSYEDVMKPKIVIVWWIWIPNRDEHVCYKNVSNLRKMQQKISKVTSRVVGEKRTIKKLSKLVRNLTTF